MTTTHYFVTGGTGVVGSALVPALLADPAAEVTLLVRAEDAPALQRRVDALFGFWAVGSGQEADWRARVHALRGDATAPALGLAAAEYARLASTLTHIVHAAGAVRMNLPLAAARQSALGSAQQVLALAEAAQRAGRLRKVEFVSTVGVGGRLATVPERWIDTRREYHNTYEQSKAEAEDLVRGHAERGLPVTVHRPSMVVGDSRDGRILHFQVFYHLCEFLSGQRTYGLFPPLGQARLDLVSADYVAGAIARSATLPALAGRVLHLASGEGALAVAQLRETVRARWAERGLRLPAVRTLPAAWFRAGLHAAGWLADERTRRALRTLPVFLDYLATRQVFEAGTTLALLRQAGVEPAPVQRFVEPVLAYYLDRR